MFDTIIIIILSSILSTMQAHAQASAAPIQKGQIFNSFDDAFRQLAEYSHADRGSLRRLRTKTGRRFVCMIDDCAFRTYVSYQKRRKEYYLKEFCGVHTCLGEAEGKRGSMKAVKWFETKVSQRPAYPHPPFLS